eukprot:4062813-Karenia_brevis.AAC.1
MLQSDGDLWEHFYNAVRAKGPQSVCISKMQGRATAEQVQAGDVRAVDKDGNDKADEAADKGVEVHGKEVVRAAN